MIHRKPPQVNNKPPTVAEFLKVNPLPRELRNLEPSLRKLPHAGILIDVLIGCLQYDLDRADFDRIITDVGQMFSAERQRCATCFHWTPQFHAVLIGSAESFRVIPMCDPCVGRFEAGRQTRQMETNMNAYAGGEQ